MLLCFYWRWPENGLCGNERFLVLQPLGSLRQNNAAECICWKKTKYIIVLTVITGAKCFFINSPFFHGNRTMKTYRSVSAALYYMFYAMNEKVTWILYRGGLRSSITRASTGSENFDRLYQIKKIGFCVYIWFLKDEVMAAEKSALSSGKKWYFEIY